ncbi:MAG: serine/threonine protein kinase [Polyangiaceae bacterium]|nr:serine/threonine protein kinase [Polyangiaceae bacterium]
MSGATEKGALDDTLAFSGERAAPNPDATQAATNVRATDDTAPAADSSALDTSIAGPKPPIVAGYDIVKILGQGGMGVVWEARDHKLGRTVALKVHSGDPAEKEALWVEARLAAKIAHPGVVPVHDVGFTAHGDPFYTMDLLEGTSLKTLLRDGKIPHLRALSIMNNVAEAVAVAHERGVVHCDLKPGNIFIDTDGRARVLDFGLAFTAAGTAAHALGPARGSPPYMSPEQIAGSPLSAATDVYSLGVVLFEMITATLPFQGYSTVELFSAITLDPAPKPSSRAPNVGESLDALCLACLQKKAELRPQNARALQREIRRLLEGDEKPEPEAPKSVHKSPQSVRSLQPRAQTGDRRTFRFEVLVDATPAELWPLVSNTDRFNSAVGLPAVTFEPLADPRGAARKSGRFRVLGMDVAWEEHPFEWSREREHAVFRKYTSGPLAWLQNRVTLTPNGEQTNLVHEVTVAPRSLLGTLSAFWEIQWKMGRRAHAVYRRMGEAVRRSAPRFRRVRRAPRAYDAADRSRWTRC